MKRKDIIAIVGGIAALAAVVLLWRARPSPGMWLLGSFVWAGVVYPGFFWYVTRDN